MALSAESTLNTFACPFADRCSCRVKFRIAATAFKIKLDAQGEHTAESHVQDKISKFLSIEQTAALEQMLSLHPARGINSGWPRLAGFDSTFGIASKKFGFFYNP